MTAPLAHTAIGANPSASTTGCIQRGGRPVATRKCAPAATAARTASRVRGVMVSFSSNNVPSTSQAMSAGVLTFGSSRRSAAWSRQRDPLWVGPGRRTPSVPCFFSPSCNSAIRSCWETSCERAPPAKSPGPPVLRFGMRILLLHPVQDRVHRLAQRGVELLGGATRRQRSAGRDRDRNLVAQQLLWMIFGPNSVGPQDDQGNYRHLRLQRQPSRSRLELPQFVTAT